MGNEIFLPQSWQHARANNPRKCSVPSCTESHKARGFCASHYAQFKRGMNPDSPINKRQMVKLDCCEIEGCDYKVKSKNLCYMHYARLQRFGRTHNIDQTKPLKKCKIEGCNKNSYCKEMYHPHYTQEHTFPKKYGITGEQFRKMLKEQNNVCLICKKPELAKWQGSIQKTLAVDHDHKTGKVRGLLCHRCNKALGEFNDDVALLQTAIDYLKQNS